MLATLLLATVLPVVLVIPVALATLAADRHEASALAAVREEAALLAWLAPALIACAAMELPVPDAPTQRVEATVELTAPAPVPELPADLKPQPLSAERGRTRNGWCVLDGAEVVHRCAGRAEARRFRAQADRPLTIARS